MHAFIVLAITGILKLFGWSFSTNTTHKKAWSDLKSNPGRTILVILALIIGSWGAGSIIVSYSILSNDLNENFLKTNPEQVVIISKDFGKLNIEDFRNRPEIETAEFRDLSYLRIQSNPNEWIPMFLFSVEDFNNIELAQFYPQKGKKIPDPGTMLIERDCLLISDLSFGSKAKVRAGTRTLEIPISGICFDPAQAPATQDHLVYTYVDPKTFTEITGEQTHQRLIFRLKNANSPQEIRANTQRIVESLKTQGIALEKLKYTDNKHPHQWELNTLLFLEGSIGLLAFLMASVMVSQLMSAILAQQVRQMGILKAIGASRKQIFKIYLSMLMIIGVVSSAISIPLSVWSGYVFAGFVAKQINFEILTTTLSPHLYIVLAIIGLILPVLFSLPALLRGVNISVYDALSDYGIRQSTRIRNAQSSIRLPFPNRFVMAFRNTMRRKKRMAITVATLGLGVAIFSSGFNVEESLKVLLSDYRDMMRYDVQVFLRNQMPKEKAMIPFASVKNISRVDGWNGGKGELQSRFFSTKEGVGIFTMPYNTDLLKMKIIEGRWLGGSGKPEAVLNQQAIEAYKNPLVGSDLELNFGGKQLKVTVVGVAEEMEKPKIYIDSDFYNAVANPNHHINNLIFVAQDRSFKKVMALRGDIEQAIAKSDLDVVYVLTPAERTKIIYDHLLIIIVMLAFLASLVLIVAALGMASSTSINIMERTREIGVLRAIGSTPKKIYGLFVIEGMIIVAASLLVGLLLSWPMSVFAAGFFGALMLENGGSLTFAVSNLGFVLTLLTTVIFGWLASRIPARKAIKVSTREALSYE